MLDYYYVDLYFDPERKKFPDVADGCVRALIEAGCRFKKVVMSSDPSRGRLVAFDEHVALGPADIRQMASAYASEAMDEQRKVLSFPPLGRIIFEYDFRFDEASLEDIREEEDETRSGANDVGLSFIYSENAAYGRKIKATVSMWEEFVLSHGEASTNLYNMACVLNMVESVYRVSGPYFGAMNTEIHLDADSSLEALRKGRLPAGNEFALVGKDLAAGIDRGELARSGLRWRALHDGGLIIQFSRRWDKALI